MLLADRPVWAPSSLGTMLGAIRHVFLTGGTASPLEAGDAR